MTIENLHYADEQSLQILLSIALLPVKAVLVLASVTPEDTGIPFFIYLPL
jgi:hypothetical protein